ncbi:hypothetical protein [Saccharolobus solfataricus]|uniref:Uncharacterized protein SSO3021 n=4 Tax=Saccharolobus solfataricus TaxID=2287 RepID=Y3021_SACS2|nr:hypothetical protein [Saccharolobus solfataricus]P22795.2 RecName: Full=Uncharacterized protein SSO3021 [Saccharolobus solfataricus P2]AKA73171.1 hypothetical protein SULB_0801 [Saccharolobus solfataricus]AKA75869.1 hypothetical protein SULC_0799 [Saccharolobus solfataricus]AKA78561.1 hypothetical protein SULA_0799 [Saccharolobus solfataricus]AZF83357.1 hypothetical protein SULZ_04140 [Saccharolobus solfataricus]QPG50157.1 hypothetical protein HFC64_10345 [Saccharolobus solfataricus]
MKEFKLAVYVTAPTLRGLNEERIKKLIEKFKELGVVKIYLENYRDGIMLDVNTMIKFKEVFEREFEVAGGMAIGTWGEGWGEMENYGFKVACIADERNREMVKNVVEEQAKVFDEIIIDDFWANWCHSEKDVKLFNSMYGVNFTKGTLLKMLRDPVISRLWCEYSSSLVYNASRDYVVKPAKNVNEKVKITLKVAEWREDFYHRGLKLDKLAEIFDNIYVGTEAREYTARYGSLYIVDYVKGLVGDKLKGVWFDTFIGGEGGDYGSFKTYLQQFILSAFGLTEEITLFEAGDILDPERRSLFESIMENKEKVQRWREDIREYASIGLKRIPLQHFMTQRFDKYVEDHLGIIGIPLEVSNVVNPSDILLITESDIYHLDIVDLLNRGVNLMFTASAAKKLIEVLGDTALKILGVGNLIYDSVSVNALTRDGKTFYWSYYKRQANFPVGPIFSLNGATPILYAYNGVELHPVVFQNTYSNSKVYVLSLTTYLPYLISEFYPSVARQIIRDIVGDHIGIRAIATYPFLFSLIIKRDGLVTVLNLNDFPIRLTLSVDPKRYKINNIEGMKVLQSNENEIRIRLKENSFGIVRLEKV